MAPIAAVKIVKPVSVEVLARPAWKVVMHCACAAPQWCVGQGDRRCALYRRTHRSTEHQHASRFRLKLELTLGFEWSG